MSISNLKLYQLTSDYERAINGFFDGDEHKDDLISELKCSFEEKCIAVAKYIRNMEAEAAAIKEAAKAMTERYKRVEKHIESLTEYLRFNLEKSGLADPIKCLEFDIKLQQNPVSLIIFDAELIPEMYKITEEIIKIDKEAIKKDIKDGFDIEGCKLESKKRLVIK